MEMLKRFEPMALFLLIVGGLNWGILGLSETNVLAEIFGTGTLVDVIYVLVGVAALITVPRLLQELHVGHGPHPRGV
jgi:hypothetical protein